MVFTPSFHRFVAFLLKIVNAHGYSTPKNNLFLFIKYITRRKTFICLLSGNKTEDKKKNVSHKLKCLASLKVIKKSVLMKH